MEPSGQEIWDEIRRTVTLIEGYHALFDEVEHKLLSRELSGDDAEALVQVVADAQILCGLIRNLERRGIQFD